MFNWMCGSGSWGSLMWLGMVLWWGFWLVVLVGGGLFLYRALARRSPLLFSPAAQIRRCPSCGKSVQADFIVCPYCRADLVTQ